MQTSPEIKNIASALIQFHKEIGKIRILKDASNPFFKSRYATLSNILDAIADPLNNAELSLLQFPEGNHGLTTRLLHISGEWMEATYYMTPVKATPQDAGSAITYQRRYAVGAILSLNIDDDDDGNKASGKGNGKASETGNELESPFMTSVQEAHIKDMLDHPRVPIEMRDRIKRAMGSFTKSQAHVTIKKMEETIEQNSQTAHSNS